MMRRLACSIGLFVLAGLAPLSTALAVEGGIKGGVNVSDLHTDSSADPEDSRTGMAAGAWVGFPMSEMFSIQPEALFMMKGDQGRDVVGDTEVSVTDKVDFVQIPVLAKVGLAPRAAVHPTLYAGPALGITTSSKVSAKAETVDSSAEIVTDVKDDTKPIEMGVVFGGGLDFPVGESQKLGVEARYDMGLTNINDTSDSADTRTRTFSVMGTYGFL